VAERPQLDEIEVAERDRIDADALSWALRDVLRAGAELDHVLADRLRLSAHEYEAMDHVMTATAPVGPVDLGNRLGISSGSATGLVDRLEAAGHLRRHPHPADRRRLVLSPTDRSIRLVLDQLRPLIERIDELAREFDPADRNTIERYLRGAADRIRAHAQTPPHSRDRVADDDRDGPQPSAKDR
jgi:DNA-binding MarR family transcriptional regulator